MATTKQTTTTPKTPNYFGNLRGVSNPNINVFAAVNKGAGATGINLGPKVSEQELKRRQADAIVEHNLENSPQIDFSQFTNLPAEYKSTIMPLVVEKGAETGYYTHLSKNMGATDFIGKSNMSNLINSNKDLILNKIPNQLTLLDKKFAGFNEDVDSSLISDFVSDEDKVFISDIKSNKIKPEIDANGNISFLGVPVKELPEHFNKNYALGGAMMETYINAYDGKKKLTENEAALKRNDYRQALNKESTGGILSAAFEDVMDMGGSLLDPNMYQNEIQAIQGDDPVAKANAEKLIKEKMIEAHMIKLDEQANAGYTDSLPKITETTPADTEKDVNTWFGGFETPPTETDWRLYLSNLPGKKDSIWEEGFEIVNRGGTGGTRSFTVTRGGKQYPYDMKTFYTDKTYKGLFGMDIEAFEKLTEAEQKVLLDKAGVTSKVTGGSGGGTYLVPVSMSKTSERNKIDAGYKIDPSLNKDEIIRIISKLR